ncbi:MAG: aspartyl/asparaginyl beta-hydroxylase domain-containing protein [Chloroflexota bacterium]
MEKAYPQIRQELLALRDEKGFQAYCSPSGKSTDIGAWNVYYLDLHSVNLEENRRRCPLTTKLLDGIPRKYGHAFFSATAPKTHITPHHGPTSKKLRCQLPLVCAPDSCRLRVHDDTIILKEGEMILFDDSFEHEAWNDHETKSRLVLIFDVWHPDLSEKEIKFLNFLQTAALKRQQRLLQEHEEGAKENTTPPPSKNFFTLIRDGMQAGVADLNGEVWAGTHHSNAPL